MKEPQTAVYLRPGDKGECITIPAHLLRVDGKLARTDYPADLAKVKGATLWKLLKPGEPVPDCDAVRARRRSVQSKRWRATRRANLASQQRQP